VRNKENPQNKETYSAPQFNEYTETVVRNWELLTVSKLNTHVSVDESKIEEAAQKFFSSDFQLPSWQSEGIFPRDSSAFISFILTTNTINAAFNSTDGQRYAVTSRTGDTISGSFAMLCKFYERFLEVPITINGLKELFPDSQHLAHFFRGQNNIPYPNLRFKQVMDFVMGLEERRQEPLDLIKETKYVSKSNMAGIYAFDQGTNNGLVDLLISRFPLAYGSDKGLLNNLEFPFYKRAQLVALQVHGRAVASLHEQDSLLLPILDAYKIGPAADYQIPRVLRHLDILKMSDDLKYRIQSGVEIQSGSAEEIEIRASMTSAMLQLLKRVNDLRVGHSLKQIGIPHLDYWLWTLSREIPSSIKPHVTRTMAY